MSTALRFHALLVKLNCVHPETAKPCHSHRAVLAAQRSSWPLRPSCCHLFQVGVTECQFSVMSTMLLAGVVGPEVVLAESSFSFSEKL